MVTVFMVAFCWMAILFLVLPLLVATLSTSYRGALYIIPSMILPIYTWF
ncbi:hypothetical protein [Bacillus mycoides]|nr:hypothetical protein [Bacillus mycoides]